jgi:hypothetical protein
MNNDDKRAEQLRQAAAGMNAAARGMQAYGRAVAAALTAIGEVRRKSQPAELPAEQPAVLERSALPLDGKKWIAFHDYERQPGERGAEGRPEYKVRELWNGHETDAIYTFDPEWADRMFKSVLEQAYGAELYRREAGGWELIKVAAALDNGGHA